MVLIVGLLSGYNNFKVQDYSNDWIYFGDNDLITVDDSFPIDVSLSVVDSGMMMLDDPPITTRIKNQSYPAIAYSSQVDEYMVVWQDEFSDNDYDIYGRRVASDGAPLSSEISIAISSLYEHVPAITYNPYAEEYLVVWSTYILYKDSNISGRRVTCDGTLMGSEINITTESGIKSSPDITYNSVNNEYLVVWEQSNGISSPKHIYGQRLDNFGSPIGNPIIISSGTNKQLNPVVAYDPVNGRYLVVFEDQEFSVEYQSSNISGQLIRNNGVLYGDEIAISTWQFDQIKPRLAYNNIMNEFFVIWEDHHWGWGDARDIYGQRINADGTLMNSNFAISWEGVNPRENPDVVYSFGADEYLVTWEYEDTVSDHDIYCRRIRSDGTLIEDEKKVSALINNENRPALASDNNLSFLVVWEDDRDTLIQGLNIYGNLVSLNLLSGYVYEGNIGDETTPISGVILDLYCSNDIGILGNLIDSTVTDSDGWFGFVVSDTCEFYNILEIDPLDYTSVGAATGGGTLVTNNHIQFEYPFDNKTLSGNKFWDYIEVETSLADLVISDFGNEDDLIWYNIRNIGNETALKGYYIALFVDDAFIISDLVTVDLEPGEQWNSSFDYSWDCTAPNDKVEIVVDYDGDVVEQDETNNQMNKTLECDNNPPYTPSNPFPSDKATGVDINVNLNWIGGDPDGDLVTYDVFFGFTNPPPKVVDNQSVTFYDPGAMNNHTTYYWKIVAWDSHGLKSESNLWMFSTEKKPPSPSSPPIDPIVGIGGLAGSAGIIYTIYRFRPKKDGKRKKTDNEEEEEEKKEATYRISAVKYNKKHTNIIKVRTHEYKDDKMGIGYIEDRGTVIKNLLNNKTYHTTIKNNFGKWIEGEKIRIIKIKNKEFIKTDNNKTEVDNLKELPEF